MSSLFIKRVGFSMVLGLASVQAMAASSDDFVEAATEAGIAEVVTGKLALEKTQNAEIKTFAQQMVTDHTQANQKLGDIARKLDISVPDEAARKCWTTTGARKPWPVCSRRCRRPV